MSLLDRIEQRMTVTVDGVRYNAPVTLCITRCDISRDERICAHTNPSMDNRPVWVKLDNAKLLS